MQYGFRSTTACLFLLLSFVFLSDFAHAGASMAGHQAKTYSKLIERHAHANGIPVALALAVVKAESGFNPRVTGSAGEIGLMQIKLSTARGLGYSGSAKGLYDPATNIKWGMKYLGQAHKLAKGSECGALSRYNGGHGTTRMIRSYCNRVMAAK